MIFLHVIQVSEKLSGVFDINLIKFIKVPLDCHYCKPTNLFKKIISLKYIFIVIL